MTPRPLHPGARAALEYGPTVAFVVAYLFLRNGTYVIGGTAYSGLIAVTAAFIPIFLIAIGTLWALTGQVARIQVATAVMVALFGGLGIWMNDARLFQMKPTAIYLALALLLGIGLLRGQSWLEYIMEDTIPLKPKGWMILTKRVTVLFLLSAAANELVWRTQSEHVWVLFETLAMPVVIFVFFIRQVGLFMDHGTLKPSRKKH